MANAIWEKVQESCGSLKDRMGGIFSSSESQLQLQQQLTRQASITCDDCGRIFTVSPDFSSTDKKKRCDRLVKAGHSYIFSIIVVKLVNLDLCIGNEEF